MSKDKKPEPKNEVKVEAPPAPGNGHAAPRRSTPLILASAGVKLATPQDLATYDQQIIEKLGALQALLNEVPVEIRASLAELIEQANPVKEGKEKLEERRGVELPRVNIAQPTSNKASKPDMARPGDLYTDNGAMLEKPWQFIPVYFYEEHVNFPQGAKAPECVAPDAKFGMPFGTLCAGNKDHKACDFLPYGKQPGEQ